MFSKSITNSSNFLMMPQSSQNLYFHLGMNADDDGFCEHFSLMRMTDSKPDDLKILITKGYVHVFDDKVLIVKDWKENNYLRNDRYTPSKYLAIYKDELDKLSSGIPVVDKVATQVRLGKDSIEEDRKESLSYLDSLPKEESESLSLKFKCEPSEVTTKARTLADYCRSKGKRYKNYKAFLSNALRRDYGERPPKARVPIYDTSSGVARIIGYK